MICFVVDNAYLLKWNKWLHDLSRRYINFYVAKITPPSLPSFVFTFHLITCTSSLRLLHSRFLSFNFILFYFTQSHKVLVEIDSKDREYNEITSATDTNATNTKKRKKDSPSPIALEPCAGNKAAVLSLLVRLPTGTYSIF